MAGQGATSLQGIGSHRRRNQSLYATEMHLSLAWTSLLWFHGVWYGLSLFCFHSQQLFLSSEMKDRILSKFTVTLSRFSGSTAHRLADTNGFSVYVHISAHMFAHPAERVFLCIRPDSLSIQETWVCPRDAASIPFPSVHRGPICISLNAEQMDRTAVALQMSSFVSACVLNCNMGICLYHALLWCESAKEQFN